jgi:hypothetical protein
VEQKFQKLDEIVLFSLHSNVVHSFSAIKEEWITNKMKLYGCQRLDLLLKQLQLKRTF